MKTVPYGCAMHVADLTGMAWQSSTDYDGVASFAVDGNVNIDYLAGYSCSHTAYQEKPWLAIDMGEAAAGKVLKSVTVYNRGDLGSGKKRGGGSNRFEAAMSMMSRGRQRVLP
jgi:hypothetical protein